MRTLGEIIHPQCKISIFSWNQKYLIKVEQGSCEQIYKVEHLDIESEAALRARLDEKFIQATLERFASMRASIDHLRGF